MKRNLLGNIAFSAFALVISTAAVAQNAAPLSIARQGYLFAGAKYSSLDGRQAMSAQLYAEFQIPTKIAHPYPIVMIHGGGQTGTNFTGTPDGREGWAQFFLRQGYAVYVVDQPGRGRASFPAELYGPLSPAPNPETVQQRFTSIERYNLWPQAHLHSQWPGDGKPGDPIFDQFMASQVPGIPNFTEQQRLNRDAIVSLLEKIGPAILLTHSQSGAFGWPVADVRPDLVRAIVAVEPSGPPFFDLENVGAPEWFRYTTSMTRPWGVTADPLVYSPLAGSASDLNIVRQEQADAPDLGKCWIQRDPARQLINLQKIPILIVTSEASYHGAYDHCTVKYLEQAGVHPAWIKLAEIGIHGNGHMMMLEKNNLEIAAVLARWLGKTVQAGAYKKS